MATIGALRAAWEGPGLEHLRRRVDGDSARWRFRSLDSGFTAELPVDEVGLVRDYPGIARRLR